MCGSQESVHENAPELAASLIPHAEGQAGGHHGPAGIRITRTTDVVYGAMVSIPT